MTQTGQEALERHLATFVVPQTGRAMGGAGTTLAVTASPNGWRVAVRCGFPAAHARDGLIEALRVHCAGLAGVGQIEFEVTSEIVTHAVQHGLKPLPGVRNVLAVASGKGGVASRRLPSTSRSHWPGKARA